MGRVRRHADTRDGGMLGEDLFELRDRKAREAREAKRARFSKLVEQAGPLPTSALASGEPPAAPRTFEERYDALFVPGAKVRLTGTFLKNTGQQRGGEGHKVWSVAECPCDLCAHCGLVAVDERGATDPERPRHIARKNLMVLGGPPRAGDYP